MTPVYKGIFQNWQLGTELRDKTFNFEDNIGLLGLKMIVWKKQLLSVHDIFNSGHLEQSYGTKHSVWRLHMVNIISIRWNLCKKVQPKYGSGVGSGSRVDPPKLTSLYYSYGDKKLQMIVVAKKLWLIPQLHMSGIHVKKLKIWSSQQKMELTNNSEWETHINLIFEEVSKYIKTVSSKLSFRAIKIVLEK